MGPDVVVENSEFIECVLQCTATWNNQLPEQRLERAEQALDPAVLPGGVFLDGLVLHANRATPCCRLHHSMTHRCLR